jgi:hypothetical protein
MLKRRLEAFVRGRNAWSQHRELRLKVLTHNVMILLRIQVFYRAGQNNLLANSSYPSSYPPPRTAAPHRHSAVASLVQWRRNIGR